MASYHFAIKTSSNFNATANAHADYICREGCYASGEKAEELVYKEHGNMPDWAKDNPRDFWKASEQHERGNGTSYREMELALPNELSEDQQIKLVQRFVQEHLGNEFVYPLAGEAWSQIEWLQQIDDDLDRREHTGCGTGDRCPRHKECLLSFWVDTAPAGETHPCHDPKTCDQFQPISESIDYAIRSNAMEGLVTSEESRAMLRRVATGELTFEDMRRAIDHKARELGKGRLLGLAEAWEEVCKSLKNL